MKSEIIKTRFYCRGTSQISTGGHMEYTDPAGRVIPGVPFTWQDRFVEGKWYDGEYETWSFKDGYKLNGGWKSYWVINEQGVKEKISKPYMNVIFEYRTEEMRDIKIDDILNKS
jgi:hypothetical protein